MQHTSPLDPLNRQRESQDRIPITRLRTQRPGEQGHSFIQHGTSTCPLAKPHSNREQSWLMLRAETAPNSAPVAVVPRHSRSAWFNPTQTMPHRSCTVEINNSSGSFTLTEPRLFTESGCCEVPPPPMIGPYSNGSAFFNKSTGAATGAVGVLTYNLFNNNLDYGKVLAVMYSVPYDRNLYSNWCAVGVFDRGTECDYNLYDIMYNGSEDSFSRAKADGSSVCYQADYVMVNATMSDSGEAVVRVDISELGMY
ncbi:DELTA-thalatoxin-Avl1a [Merluccius polli]|uniref:DELTA-thalatoxin-Avl1a n=1 Tax=Merluccius polli TaxID=89951 RepID=A0AA47P494_MERPO|nr:DELTA-thalatoxin-Avl1a [Merluccius polli]KAK0152589.1 DELTA-thalatoxin-Avl1a [Merluccius polli]